jgi:hypothetical protein
MTLQQLAKLFANAGCVSLYAKQLAENDNSKNQVYFAGAVEALNVFPSTEIYAENTKKGPSFKARLNYSWLLEDGRTAPSPHAQLILYSQYPEVRFSGFLLGCKEAPSKLMMDRERAKLALASEREKLCDRVLFMGVTSDRKVLGHVVAGNSEIAGEFRARNFPHAFVVFRQIPLPSVPEDSETKNALLLELHRIHELGWIQSKQLDSTGITKPCNAPQCGGFTLEAELRIPKNSQAEPDFLGWEVKQHKVSSFFRPESGGAITLMTPEPTQGLYRERGAEEFVRRYGYTDMNGIPDRLNFGGVHYSGVPHAKTGLTMVVHGYDIASHKITDAQGAIRLIDTEGNIAAAWPFAGLLSHWSRKHSKAVYVPSLSRDHPYLQYSYGNLVRLAQRTDSLKLLKALASGQVFYDPGIKLEDASTKPKLKKRSQFRIKSNNISFLYETVEKFDVSEAKAKLLS